MSVKLISLTQPKIDGATTAEELIAYIARVSNPDNQANHETAARLIRYLIRKSHWSPLEQVYITLEIETTRDIGRQILRHRSFTFQEFSQRYADPTQSLGFTTREARLQDPKNRQNSIDATGKMVTLDGFIGEPITVDINTAFNILQKNVITEAKRNYNWAIENGIAKEQARVFLPEGLTLSRMYMTGSLRSWYHYCSLRRANGTQKEHMLIADECWEVISKEFPATAAALEEIEASSS